MNPPKERNQTALTMMVHGYNTLFGAMGLHVNYERGGEDGSVVRVFSRETGRFSEGGRRRALRERKPRTHLGVVKVLRDDLFDPLVHHGDELVGACSCARPGPLS